MVTQQLKQLKPLKIFGFSFIQPDIVLDLYVTLNISDEFENICFNCRKYATKMT